MSHFEKVSFEQFEKDAKELGFNGNLQEIYDKIKLPSRGSSCSAGYDFYSPFNINFYGIRVKDCANGETFDDVKYNYVTVPTGIRWVTNDCFDKNTVLVCVPRSGQGFKYGFQLANTCGVIDADYCHSDNEGHIKLKATSEVPFTLEAGKGFMQGIIMMYFTTDNDDCSADRNGGFGSTDIKG